MTRRLALHRNIGRATRYLIRSVVFCMTQCHRSSWSYQKHRMSIVPLTDSERDSPAHLTHRLSIHRLSIQMHG